MPGANAAIEAVVGVVGLRCAGQAASAASEGVTAALMIREYLKEAG
jgi:thioredoxin reductase